MWRYSVIFFSLLLLYGWQLESAVTVKPKKVFPNIIYILADDLGYGDVKAFNPQSKIQTPNLDKLASEGMKFTDAHSPSAVCTPTRYGILTGRYSWRSALKKGVLTGISKALIPSSEKTVASLLKSSGYQTAFIGKWHLGWDWALKNPTDTLKSGWNYEDFGILDFSQPVKNTPNDLGFDYAYGHSGSLDMAPYVYVENGRTTAKINSVTENKDKYTWWRKGPTAADFAHEQVTPNFFRKALEYISNQASKPNPFFLYLALPSPHTPILPTADWQNKSSINPYADFVMMIDFYVGEMVSLLEKEGLTKNTIIIFTSDNGCSPEADFKQLASKGHNPSYNLRGHKADIYEGGHRIPFIVKWPAIVKPNSTCIRTICLTDLMATCSEITGKPLGEEYAEDSYSILPLLKDPLSNDFQREATVHHSINGSFAIRKDQWKLIFCPGSGGWSDPKPNSDAISDLPKIQLYNLEMDPGETNNLQAENPEKVSELTKIMKAYIQNGRSTPGPILQNTAFHLNGEPWIQINAFISE